MPAQEGEVQSIWNIARIRQVVHDKLGKRPCWFQIQVAQALYMKQKDVVGISATGSGKTLSFWIPLLMALEEGHDKMTIVVTPLNLLGKQNVASLQQAGISAVAVSADNASPEIFTDIETGKYKAVVVCPEILMQNRGVFEKMWKKETFTSRLLNFIVDEGHVVKQWASFRPEYKYLGQLRSMIPETVPFYVASATLPKPTLQAVKEHLRLRPNQIEMIQYSNDRPNIQIIVRELKHAAKTFKDLAFLIPENQKPDSPPPKKFLVFFDNMKESEAATAYLRSRLPPELRSKITYFHSVMSDEYRKEKYEDLKRGEIWGLCVTDSFGMGLDLDDIYYVVQWKVTCDLNSLWQRFGRGGRGEGTEAVAILLAEKKHFEARPEEGVRASGEGGGSAGKRRRDVDENEPPRKRRATGRTQTGTHRKQGAATRPNKRKTSAVETSESTNLSKRPHLDKPSAGGSTASIRCPSPLNSMLDTTTPANSRPEGNVQPTESDVEDRRRKYHLLENESAQNKGGKTAGRGKREIIPGSAMDDLINAGVREGLTCRREVLNVYYENDKCDTNTFRHCDTSSPTGCERCAPKAAGPCCDLCSPHLLTSHGMKDVTNIPRATRTTASRLKAVEFGTGHRDLRTALLAWRSTAAEEKHGKMVVRRYGSQIVMSEQILDRLVLCAQARKISTTACIKRETQWRPDWVDEYGPAVISILHEHFPLHQPLTPSIQIPSATNNMPSTGSDTLTEPAMKTKRVMTCSACGGKGHNRSNRQCPKYGPSHPAAVAESTTAPQVAHPRQPPIHNSLVYYNPPDAVQPSVGTSSHLPYPPTGVPPQAAHSNPFYPPPIDVPSHAGPLNTLISSVDPRTPHAYPPLPRPHSITSTFEFRHESSVRPPAT